MNAAADETSSREPQDAAASMSSREACLPLGSGEREGNGAGDGSETESPNPKDVWVHVYHCDPYTGFLNRMLLKNSEIGIYHAGIEVYGEEWSFQYFEDTWNDPTISGIIRCAPKQMSGYEYQESLNLGPTSLSEVEVDDLLETLCDEYSASTYHLTHRNCLTFAQHLAGRLQAPRPFPDWILGILEASTRVGAVDATVDYFWSWAKWYMIRKHEPPEDPPPQPPQQQANTWSMLGLYPTCSPSMCPGPAKDAHESESAPPVPQGMQAVNMHDEQNDRLVTE
mmetsp:Transcript_44140/g.103170  ORF Transcript_44140/g.103170 Transcript_44140/m.103170 type:complete len:282 (-) Transcript_44140:166-1011(-)|eukprot:s323_g31.t1